MSTDSKTENVRHYDAPQPAWIFSPKCPQRSTLNVGEGIRFCCTILRP